MTALSDLLTASNTNRWTTREIAGLAEKKGHQLAQPTVSKYLSGRHGRPTEPVLAAFSDVLNIPIHKLRAAAGVPTGAGDPWQPPAEANRLDRRQRRALEELIRSMVTSEADTEDEWYDQLYAADVDRHAQPDGVTPPAPKRRPRQEDYDRAADASGPSLLEADDARAAARGEESQDPGSDEPA
ncbi:helix-turn-helix transcriptional regulator [Brachybacterium paraconglomeratum]|uniref:helix-turn-helix transcriptional regulator n=1 Tax=Brachybacterium paraconglomeratum TaxID=173362 RepID=UPI00026C6F10|nr:helix-turn-helix transcriptional regulator [Brachybacterium paraconglomeratum]